MRRACNRVKVDWQDYILGFFDFYGMVDFIGYVDPVYGRRR